MAETLYRCVTKATTAEGDDIRRSLNWVISRRAFLVLYADHLKCGDWIIPYGEIDEAVLFRVRQGLIPGYVLRIKTRGQIYQFGLNPGRFWRGPLPFPVTRESAALGYSWFSLILRGAALAYLVFLLWRRLT